MKGYNSHDYLRLFRHIQQNQPFYRIYFKLGYDNQFKLQYYDIHQAELDFGNHKVEYHIEFFRCGLNAIIKMWLANGCRETPEEMNSIILGEYQGRRP